LPMSLAEMMLQLANQRRGYPSVLVAGPGLPLLVSEEKLLCAIMQWMQMHCRLKPTARASSATHQLPKAWGTSRETSKGRASALPSPLPTQAPGLS
jgi:hypothetical protein